MAGHAGCLADAVEDHDEVEDIVRWSHDTYDNEVSIRWLVALASAASGVRTR